MRVIGGHFKRRTLKEVPSEVTRSTKDSVKESLFNMIMPYLYEGRALDLFAGSGALGIEAISRGVPHVDFCERDKTAFNILKYNINHLKLQPQATLYLKDAIKVLESFTNPYDIIFLDPPYHTDLLNQAIEKIVDYHLLDETGIIVVLCGKNQPVLLPKTLTIVKAKTYGITDLKLIKWSEE